MNPAQLHLLFNHWPLVLLAVGFSVLFIGNRRLFVPYQQLGLTILVIAALLTIPVQFSGGGAKELLLAEGLAGQEMIERHAGFGFWTAMLVYAIGILSFVCLITIHNSHVLYGRLRTFVLVLSAAAFVLIALAAHTGGEIMHPEIRNSLPFLKVD